MYEIPQVCAIEPVDALRCQKYENLKLLFFPGESTKKTFAAYEQSNSELFLKLQINCEWHLQHSLFKEVVAESNAC